MNIDPCRMHKLFFGGVSFKSIARRANKRQHTIKSWIKSRVI